MAEINRRTLNEALMEVMAGHGPMVLTYGGKDVAVMVSADEWQGLKDEIDRLSQVGK